MSEIQTIEKNEIVQNLVLNGDLSKMTPDQKVEYYQKFCQSLGLNPLTQPFQLITFQGKQRLYATKDCTEQLRKLHGVSIVDLNSQNLGGVYVVTAKAQDKHGKTDASTGAVPIENLKGEALANALMKAETKAKRRVTLSICGMGMLDESELDTMPNHTTAPVTATAPIELPKVEPPQAPEILDLINAYSTLIKDNEDLYTADEIAKLQPKANWTEQKYIDNTNALKAGIAKRKAEKEAANA